MARDNKLDTHNSFEGEMVLTDEGRRGRLL
jgi:hypothetical protein